MNSSQTDQQREKRRKDVEAVITQGLSKPVSYHTLTFLKILSVKEDDVVDAFLQQDGIGILLSALEKFEFKSRSSNNHSTIIAILKLLDMLGNIERSILLILQKIQRKIYWQRILNSLRFFACYSTHSKLRRLAE